MVRELPKFKGYTVDFRLRQFRRAVLKKGIKFVDFDSKRGQRLLDEMIEQGLVLGSDEARVA